MSEQVTFESASKAAGKECINVYIGKRIAGQINSVSGGYQYTPRGQKEGGEVFKTIAACKQSLIGDD